jgi:hypothetical protein
MPNIVIELRREMGRVSALLEKLDAVKRDDAQRSIRFAELSLQQSALNDMYESLDELREFKA